MVGLLNDDSPVAANVGTGNSKIKNTAFLIIWAMGISGQFFDDRMILLLKI